MSVADLIRPEIQALTAYRVPDARGLIKLDAMENPYPLPEAARADWLEALRDLELNRYPDPQGRALQAALRESMAIPAGMDVLLGNGSDELIQMLALAVSTPGRALLAFEPGFAMYRMIACFAGLNYLGVPLRCADFGLDLDATLKVIERERPALIFIAYPNNPTGNLFEVAALERIAEASAGLVIVDEAYAPFAAASFLPRLGDWPNLLVLRTLSKMGLAGLRLGYLAGPPDWIDAIDKVRLPYNVNVLTQASAAFALRHQALFDAQTRRIRAERERVFARLAAMGSIAPYPSEANFLLTKTPAGRAGAIFAALKAGGILIKNLDGVHPLLADCLRLTIGTPDENDALLERLTASLGT